MGYIFAFFDPDLPQLRKQSRIENTGKHSRNKYKYDVKQTLFRKTF